MRLLRSTALVSAMTFISRVSGFVRDQVYAITFGASPAMDAFFVAFRIPNFLRRLSAEGSFSLAFVPVLSEYKETRSQAEVKELVDRVTGTLMAALLVLTGIAVLCSPWVIGIFAPGYDCNPAQHRLASDLLRITFPYLFFISLASLAGGILNSYHRFAVPAVSPVLMNVAMIAAALGIAPLFAQPVEGLAWGVLLAGVLQLAVQLPALKRLGLLPRPRRPAGHSGVRKIFKLMVPTLFGSSVAQVNLLFDTIVATFLLSGSVTWLYFTDRLLEFPLGMFGVAIGTVILPHLSARHASTDPEGFSKGMDWGLRLSLLIGVPACIGLVMTGVPLFSTMFQHGQFTAHDAEMSALSLRALALGLPAFLLVKVLAPGFYARQDTRTPVKAAVVSLLANVLFTILLLGGLLYLTPLGDAARAAANTALVATAEACHKGVSSLLPASLIGPLSRIPGAHACLALASALAGWLNAGQLWWYLRRDRVFHAQPGWGRFALQLLVASVAMVIVLSLLLSQWQDWSTWPTVERLWKLTALIAAAGAAYAAALLATGFRPRDLRH